ncbi:MAG: hemolysin family protein [Candidatus Nanopelagicales bacterium]
MSSWAVYVVAALLLAIGGTLVAFETALGRISSSRIDELFSGERRLRLQGVIDDRVRYVTVLLFVRQALTALAIVLVAQEFARHFGILNWRSTLGASGVMLLGTFIVLGVAPRTLGRQHVDGFSRVGAPVALTLAALLGPVTKLLIMLGNAVTPGKGFREGPFATAAELRELVDVAEASSVIEDDERRMIHSVFELGETIAREVMVPRTEMVFIERNKTLRQAMSLGLRSGYSRIPVVGEDADDVLGVIYLKDITRRVYEHRDAESQERVESLMRPAVFVPDSKRADDLLRDMQAARTHLAIVVDEYGGTAGIVTIEDILEEIVGEIEDEYDTAAPEIEELQHGAFRVSSRLHLDDLAELLSIELDGEEEGVETVAGLLGKRIGRVPIPGSELTLDGWHLVAESVAGRRNRIGSVLVTRIDNDDAAEGGE